MDLFGKRYTREEVAKLLKLSVRTLEKWKERRYGPPFYRRGRYVYYPHDGLIAWIEKEKSWLAGGSS